MCVARGKKRKTIKLTEHVFFYTAAGVRWIDGRAHTAFSKKKNGNLCFSPLFFLFLGSSGVHGTVTVCADDGFTWMWMGELWKIGPT
jgi:hypothetical protein